MKTERVQEALHDVHDHEHTESGANEHEEAHEHEKHVARFEARHHGAVVEHLSQLRVSQGQGPQTQVGGRVRDCAEHELNDLDDLMDHDLHEGVVAVSLVGVHIGVHDAVVEAVDIVDGLQLLALSRSAHVFVVVGGVVAALELLLGVHGSAVFRRAAEKIAGLDAEHERHADEHGQHEDVHQGNLVVVGRLVAEEGTLVRV
mmetsp:Transcript_35722/g.47000  ORF Transcript_35722/g.47000 Transcript_35722/m.47000 type:complete len:202 (-) Transcript_35722:685-1290(-)